MLLPIALKPRPIEASAGEYLESAKDAANHVPKKGDYCKEKSFFGNFTSSKHSN